MSEENKKTFVLAEKVSGKLAQTKDRIVSIADNAIDEEKLTAAAEKVGNAAKTIATTIKDTAELKRRELELSILRPIFPDDFSGAGFRMTNLIVISEMDKKHAESDVCKGSIGYMSGDKDFNIIHIYPDYLNEFGLSLFPDVNSEIYYVDPSDRDRYIALDDYFSHMKVQRVNELQKIAQDLGAKHFRVTLKEQKTTFAEKSVKSKNDAKANGYSIGADIDCEHREDSMSTVEISAEMDCPGHEPKQPMLYYLRREPAIQSLIELRMDLSSPLKHQRYTLQLSNSSGIKEKDAIKIDAALKAMKYSGNTTVSNAVQTEARRFFEYEVDF